MLRRQESTFSSSSSRRHAAATSSPETRRTKAIGCMSGILRFFSRSHNSRRRITFGRTQDKKKPNSVDKTEESAPPLGKSESPEKDDPKTVKTLRSPTITSEIRRSTAASSTISYVTKLMGLNDVESADKSPKSDEDPIEAKRKQLLQALEKCNQDLDALKRIITAAKTVKYCTPPPHAAAAEELPVCMEKFVVTSEEPNSQMISLGKVNGHETGTMHVVVKKPGEEEHNSMSRLDTIIESRKRGVVSTQASWISQTLFRSVEEVCHNVGWGEKYEKKRIGNALQEFLWRELIEEVVCDLKSFCFVHSFPRWACRRRLSF